MLQVQYVLAIGLILMYEKMQLLAFFCDLQVLLLNVQKPL